MLTFFRRKTRLKALIIVLCFILSFSLLGCQNTGPVKKYTSEEIAATFIPYIVEIINGYNDTAGTGFIASDKDGFPVIVTNFHVSGDDGSDLKIRFFGESAFAGSQGAGVSILGYAKELDISILSIAYKPANIDLASNPFKKGFLGDIFAKPGQRVTGLGNAFGYGISAYEGIVRMEEHVAETKNPFTDSIRMPYLLTTAKINGGSSGGPLINEYGNVIGVASNLYYYEDGERPPEEIGYAVPASMAYSVLSSALEASRSGNEGQPIKKLACSFDYNLAEGSYELRFSMLKFTVAFKAGGLEIVAASDSQMSEYVGNRIARFGDYEVSGESYTRIILETLKYSYGGAGKAFSIEMAKDGKNQTKSFDEYKQN